MIYFEFFKFYTIFTKNQVKSKLYNQYYINKVKSNVFGHVLGPNTFEFFNIFFLKFCY